MSVPEKIVQTYLRLNGFFTIPKFTILGAKAGHIDILAVRIGSSREIVGSKRRVPLDIDWKFLELLGTSEDQTIGLIVEVKGGEEEEEISSEHLERARPFFGKLNRVFRVLFEKKTDQLYCKERDGETHFFVPISHCLEFIDGRFEQLMEIEPKVREKGDITKYGSWYLSEEFLSGLIYLKSMGYYGKSPEKTKNPAP